MSAAAVSPQSPVDRRDRAIEARVERLEAQAFRQMSKAPSSQLRARLVETMAIVALRMYAINEAGFDYTTGLYYGEPASGGAR
ncbi:hypothetical protein [Rhodococcoides kroppenstedtii]|uniref:hypothetical protein n=1 Tax=Rhodococcoides kroppenstedtii TaxID=293050 RepID=UPI000837D90F|nr:hypothetical protein [Rhodococcus kroppenstedtii]